MPHKPYFALLDALARRLRGIDPAAFSQAQSLVIGGRRIDFSLEPDPHDEAESRLVLRSEVVNLSEPASEALCHQLLRANNLWAGTCGATLGLRGDNVVIASETARLGSLNPERLARLLSSLRDQAQAWAVELTTTPVKHAPLHQRA